MRRLHRIATIAVGIPLLVWTATGFAFTWFDFGSVRGGGDRAEPKSVRADDVRVGLAEALARVGGAAQAVELRLLAGRPTWILDGKRVDAVDGTLGGALGEREAVAIALGAHRGHPAVRDVARVTEGHQALDMDVPVWRVRLDDGHGTEVWVSPVTGAIVAWRNDSWRRFDALWSLHVWGFVSRDNPAQLPLRIAGGLAFVVAFTGAWILVQTYARRRRIA